MPISKKRKSDNDATSASSPPNAPPSFNDAVKVVAGVAGLMIAIFTLLSILLPTSPIQPIGALVIGLILTVILVWMSKWTWATALVTWLGMGVLLITVYLIVSRQATVIGAVVDRNNRPVVDLVLVLRDSSGVPHEVATDENGNFEIRNVPEGKYTISANGQLLSSGNIPSGWKRILDHVIVLPALVQEPTPTAVVLVSSTETPPPPASHPTTTSTSSPSAAETPAATPTPTGVFTQPDNGIRDPSPDLSKLPVVSRTMSVEWSYPSSPNMDVQFYRSGQLIKKYSNVTSGEVSLEWAPPGAIEIKLWVPGTATPLDSISVNVASPQSCAEAKFIMPDGIRDSDPDSSELLAVPDTTRIEWMPSNCKMALDFFRHAQLIVRINDAMSGEVGLKEGLSGLTGQTEIKIWVAGASAPSDSIQINVVEP